MDQPIAVEVENAEIKAMLEGVIERVHGLNAVLVSTGDGVPLIQVVKSKEGAGADNLPFFQVCRFWPRAMPIASCQLPVSVPIPMRMLLPDANSNLHA